MPGCWKSTNEWQPQNKTNRRTSRIYEKTKRKEASEEASFLFQYIKRVSSFDEFLSFDDIDTLGQVVDINL